MRTSLPLSLLLVIVLAGCGDPLPARAPTPGKPHLKVMTYNVNYGLAGDSETAGALADGWADLIFLQETTEAWEAVLRKRLGATYPHMAFRHCCGAGGLAVLSRYPFAEKDYVPSEKGWFPAWRVIVDSPLGKLQVLNVHLRPPVSDSGSVVSGYFSTPPIREAEMEQFYRALDPTLPTLVVGDFNEGSSGRAVVYLRERGLQSGLSQFDTPQDTWRWTTSVGTIYTQLDHIVYDEAQLQPLYVKVLPIGKSDHLPVIGAFELRPRPRPAPPAESTPD